MKTKKFAIASCALLFTACSDGIDEFCQQQENLHEERPQALITIDANNRTDKETRFEFKNTDVGYRWVFQDGDKMGALRMDKLKSAGQYGNWDDYEFDDLCHANRIFTYNMDEDLFYSENGGKATIDEGHYFFYYPYDKIAQGNGERIAFRVNPIQHIMPVQSHVYEDFYYSIAENQKYIGYKFIKGQNDAELGTNAQKIEMTMVPLFATPLIHIKNNSSSDFIINKIVIQRNDNKKLPTTVFLTPRTMGFGEGLATSINSENGINSTNLYRMYEETLYTPNYSASYETFMDDACASLEEDYANGVYKILKNPTLSYGEGMEEKQGAYEYVIDFKNDECRLVGSRFYQYERSTCFANIVLPPYGNENLRIYIYGKKWDTLRGGWYSCVINNDDSYHDYYSTDYHFPYCVPSGEKPIPQSSFEFDETSFRSDNVCITNSEDLLLLINGRLMDNTTADINLHYTILGDQVVITDEIVSLLEYYCRAHAVNAHIYLKGCNGDSVVTIESEKALSYFTLIDIDVK